MTLQAAKFIGMQGMPMLFTKILVKGMPQIYCEHLQGRMLCLVLFKLALFTKITLCTYIFINTISHSK